jgi:Uma2 family endonuclease
MNWLDLSPLSHDTDSIPKAPTAAITMSTATKQQLTTFDEFYLLVNDDRKADLIDGVIYMASPENTDANDIFEWLNTLLYAFVQTRKLGKVYGSRVAFRLDEHQSPEPDIAFVRTERTDIIRRGFVDGSPDLAIEIVSPESVERDYKDKRRQYQYAGVPEYWIVDEMEQKVTLLRLDQKGKYREVRPRKGVLQSDVVPGFYLRTEWLWQTPLPVVLEILSQLLAG